MKLALAQIDIVWENKETNKERITKLLQEANENSVDLLCFPEMTLTGFSMNTDLIGENSIASASTLNWFSLQAQNYNLHIGFGYVKNIDTNIKSKNNYVIVSPEGNIISEYSKIHPFSFGAEAEFYTGGDKITTSIINNDIISTFICYDLRFPEIFQIASRSAALIIVAANWPKARREHWITLLKARAIENQCFIAGINRIGIGHNIEYCGDSVIVDPYGNVMNELSSKEGLIIKTIDIEEAEKLRAAFKLKKDRKEALYGKYYTEKDELI